jgi:hypothetical protein
VEIRTLLEIARSRHACGVAVDRNGFLRLVFSVRRVMD